MLGLGFREVPGLGVREGVGGMLRKEGDREEKFEVGTRFVGLLPLSELLFKLPRSFSWMRRRIRTSALTEAILRSARVVGRS